MDEQQRQRLAIALKANGINLRRASRAVRDTAAGKPLLNDAYVREVIRRGRGTKEKVELICAGEWNLI